MKRQDNSIEQIGNVPFRMGALGSVYPQIRHLAAKAKSLEEAAEIFRLKKGLYVLSPQVSEKPFVMPLLANHIYGPSYVSMETALRYYGLIPEGVYSTISLTTGVTRSYKNKIGVFRYVHCDKGYFPIGITVGNEAGVSFLIACREKALCDQIVFTPRLNLRYQSDVARYLDEDLRFDTDALSDFDLDILRACADKGKKKASIIQLIKYIKNERGL